MIEPLDTDPDEVPVWRGMEKVYTYVNLKKLFDLGIEVKDIKTAAGPRLSNLIYAPLENPWTSIPVVIGIILIFIVTLYLCKGRVSCCTRRTTIEHLTRRQKAGRNVTHPGQAKLTKKDIIRINDLLLCEQMQTKERESKKTHKKNEEIPMTNITWESEQTSYSKNLDKNGNRENTHKAIGKVPNGKIMWENGKSRYNENMKTKISKLEPTRKEAAKCPPGSSTEQQPETIKVVKDKYERKTKNNARRIREGIKIQ